MSYLLRNGDRGQEVKRLQFHLQIPADGIFGPQTEGTVKEYQKENDLSADGIAGPLTLGALNIPVLSGVDLSSHNGTVDFKALAASGCVFAWVKVSEGTTHINPDYEEKFQGCRDHGIIVGGYHVARPDTYIDNPTDAQDEVDNFLTALNVVGIKCGDLLPALDLESGAKTDDQYNIDWTLNWLNMVRCTARVNPVIYSAKWYYDSYMKNATDSSLKELSNYPLWLASYNDGVGPVRTIPSWSTWSVWQWTGNGSVPGVKGRCDQNWMAGGHLFSLQVP